MFLKIDFWFGPCSRRVPRNILLWVSLREICLFYLGSWRTFHPFSCSSYLCKFLPKSLSMLLGSSILLILCLFGLVYLLFSVMIQWSRSVVSDSVTPWTVVYQAPPSMGFSRQEYWSGVPFPSPGDLPKLGIEPRSPALQADALLSDTTLVCSLSSCDHIRVNAVVEIVPLGARLSKTHTAFRTVPGMRSKLLKGL